MSTAARRLSRETEHLGTLAQTAPARRRARALTRAVGPCPSGLHLSWLFSPQHARPRSPAPPRRAHQKPGCCLRAHPGTETQPRPARVTSGPHAGCSRAPAPGSARSHLRCLATGAALPPPHLPAAGPRRTSPAPRRCSPGTPPCCSFADHQGHVQISTPALRSNREPRQRRSFRVPAPQPGGDEGRARSRSDDARSLRAHGDDVAGPHRLPAFPTRPGA